MVMEEHGDDHELSRQTIRSNRVAPRSPSHKGKASNKSLQPRASTGKYFLQTVSGASDRKLEKARLSCGNPVGTPSIFRGFALVLRSYNDSARIKQKRAPQVQP